MENTLKPQTTPVIQQLKEADIRTVMVTGNLFPFTEPTCATAHPLSFSIYLLVFLIRAVYFYWL